MNLLDNFYRIDSVSTDGDVTLYAVTLLPGCSVYRGHFPNSPVAPGVCIFQMLRELSEAISKKRLFMSYIDKGRFFAPIEPLKTPEIKVKIRLTPDYSPGTAEYGPRDAAQVPRDTDQIPMNTSDIFIIKASIHDKENVEYMDFTGEFTIVNDNEI